MPITRTYQGVPVHFFATKEEQEHIYDEDSLEQGHLYSLLPAAFPTGHLSIYCPIACSECPLRPTQRIAYGLTHQHTCSDALRYLFNTTSHTYRRSHANS